MLGEGGISMDKYYGFVLCNEEKDGIYVNTTASFEEGKFFINGQDYGKVLEKYFGSTSLYYWYSFDEENTQKLLKAIDGVEDPKSALIERFGHAYGTMELEKFCKKEGIENYYDCIA